jgi:FMN phosphatase YigB (HAD superfamily)
VDPLARRAPAPFPSRDEPGRQLARADGTNAERSHHADVDASPFGLQEGFVTLYGANCPRSDLRSQAVLKAAFFDIGDTLVEHWPPPDVAKRVTRAQICAELGELPWVDAFLDAEHQPKGHKSLAEALAAQGPSKTRFEPEDMRQETQRWFRDWFVRRDIEMTEAGIDRLRSLMCVPLEEVTTPVPGAFDAIRWCRDRGLRVVLVTNTLSHGDHDVLDDFRRFGLLEAIHGVASSHSVGWRKPHPAIFERALEIARVEPREAFHVGDNLILDVFGAQQLGIRAVWRRLPRPNRTPIVGQPPLPSTVGQRDGASCLHMSDRLFIDDGQIRCGACGDIVHVDLRPDAVVDDLTELPRVVAPWLDASST